MVPGFIYLYATCSVTFIINRHSVYIHFGAVVVNGAMRNGQKRAQESLFLLLYIRLSIRRDGWVKKDKAKVIIIKH